MSVHLPILARCVRHPLRVCMTDDLKPWRGIELLVASQNLASLIDRRSRSETVGIMLPTSGVFPAAALAAWTLGRTVVPLNYLLKQDELDYVVQHCGCDTVVTSRKLIEHLGVEPHGVNLMHLEDVSLGGVPEPRWPHRFNSSDLAALLYTSGTSGRPKGVMLTHGNLRSNLSQVEQWVHFTRNDTIFGVLPQFHSFGFTVLTLLPLTIGCRVVYSARFVPAQIIKKLREHRPTVMIAIPSMYNALLSVKDASPEDFASIRYIVSGGEPLPQSVFERFEERFGKRINEGYGLTETAPVTNWCRPHEFRRRSVGQAIPHVDIQIIDLESGSPVGPHNEGEIRIKGPNVMGGYFKDPESSQEAFDANQYFRTGDIGRVDREGHLYITGRHKEMLIVGGENVFPREIEEALNRHPSVHASGVVGRPHDVRGEEPVAFVELNDGCEFDESALRAWCRSQIASYKVPRRILQLDSLPVGPTGKVLRRDLKQLLESDGAAAADASADA